MKRFLALMVLLGFVGMLAGCNDSGNKPADTGTNAPVAPAAPAAPSTNK